MYIALQTETVMMDVIVFYRLLMDILDYSQANFDSVFLVMAVITKRQSGMCKTLFCKI